MSGIPVERNSRQFRRLVPGFWLFMVGGHVAALGWRLGIVVRDWLDARLSVAVFDWARIFHNPDQAALIPYVAACFAAFVFWMWVYVSDPLRSLPGRRWMRGRLATRQPIVLVALLLAPAVVVSGLLPEPTRNLVSLATAAAAFLPAFRIRSAQFELPWHSLEGAWIRRLLGWLATLGAAALLVGMSVEPMRLITRPVRLANEYPMLPERTLAYGKPVDTAELLAGQPLATSTVAALERANSLERFYQITQRGQINHIGHILNPIGERLAGKPLDRIYFQYGLGATCIFEWVMRPFGGPSIQAYYRTLGLLLLYWLVFAGAAALFFRDARYVLAAVGALAVGFYALGYRSLLVAPGYNPLLHFFDVPLLLVSARFFRAGETRWLAIGGALSAIALGINGLFGAMQTLAFATACATFLLERQGATSLLKRVAPLIATLAVPIAAVAAVLPRTGSGSSLKEAYALGWFAFRPPTLVVGLTIAYLAVGYFHLVSARRRRDPLKYANVFLFAYVQLFLVYSFWSGMPNHFWPAFPFVALHLLALMRDLANTLRAPRWETISILAAWAGLALLLAPAVSFFAMERLEFRRTFAMHQTYAWPFPRARVTGTADPAPIAETLALIERHSPDPRRGIAMLSVFNNLLPFLSGRYSVLPHFELQWALASALQHREIVSALETAHPDVLFVGREVEEELPDPWEAYSTPDFMTEERRSHAGRVQAIRRVFEEIGSGYERIDSSPLLAVYRRRAEAP